MAKQLATDQSHFSPFAVNDSLPARLRILHKLGHAIFTPNRSRFPSPDAADDHVVKHREIIIPSVSCPGHADIAPSRHYGGHGAMSVVRVGRRVRRVARKVDTILLYRNLKVKWIWFVDVEL